MGYYTNFTLSVHSGPKDQVDLFYNSNHADFDTPDGYNPTDYLNSRADSCKWYDHERDMCNFSEKFPDVVFELIGDGEEQGDSWRKYFKNGKVQTCKAKITYDEFDERKLK